MKKTEKTGDVERGGCNHVKKQQKKKDSIGTNSLMKKGL